MSKGDGMDLSFPSVSRPESVWIISLRITCHNALLQILSHVLLFLPRPPPFSPCFRLCDANCILSDSCDRISFTMSSTRMSTNVFWQDYPIGKLDRQKLLNQKGCVVWITGLSGSGKSTLACTIGRELHSRGKLSYILDGDNLRHGLNKDLGFKAEDRAENIRRVGEVSKLFSDAGLICIASLISPYRRDRESCRALLPEANFIEVFMNIPLEVCEERDPKGLYKLARAGKIKGDAAAAVPSLSTNVEKLCLSITEKWTRTELLQT